MFLRCHWRWEHDAEADVTKYCLSDEIWYLQDREEFCILGKKLLSNTCKKEKVLCTSKSIMGPNEGKNNIWGILTAGRTHFRKYWIVGIIQKYSRILETFSLMLIKSLWDELEIGSFVGTWQSLNSNTTCNFF